MENKLVIKEHTVKQEASSLKNGNTSPGSKKYKPYPKYKPSGVEWIGEIPEGWEVRKIKFVAEFVNGYAFKSELYTDDGVPIIRIGDIADVIDFNSVKRFPESRLKGLEKFKINKNDLLIALTGATIGKAFEYNYDTIAYLNQRVGIIRGKKLAQNYIKHFFYSYMAKEIISYLCNGGAQENISKIQIGNIFATLPPLSEQQAIAAFLDRETERINSIITKQTRMIELLKEKRSALITQAVTRGLYGLVSIEDTEFAEWATKKVKYKPSGVEWIGEIPEGWEVRKIKFVAEFVNGYAFKSELYTDDGVPIIRIGDIADVIDFNSVKRFPESRLKGLEKFKINKNDLLIALTGATIGKAFEYNYDTIAYLNQRVGIIRGKKLAQNYIKHFFYSYMAKEIISYLCNGGAQENISKIQIGNIFATLPPLSEQQAITAFLDRETSKIDTLVSKIEKQIELLNEYKQSLITHAVTGKIDVRDAL